MEEWSLVTCRARPAPPGSAAAPLVAGAGDWSFALLTSDRPVVEAPPHGRIGPTEPDFQSHVYLFAALGERRTGGYDIRFRGARRVGGELRVTVQEIRPPQGAFVIQVLTYPHRMAAVPRALLGASSPASVVFEDEAGRPLATILRQDTP